MEQITIEKLVEGGLGLGYLNGRATFVPWVLPGEKVKITVRKAGKDIIQGWPLEILSPSPQRQVPPCPVYQSCGGCQFQHVPFPHQIRLKEAIFKETLWRIGKIDPSLILSIIPSDKPFHYRNRSQLKVRYLNGENGLGFHQYQSHAFVPVEECILLDPLINKALQDLSAYFKESETFPSLRRVHIQCSPPDQQILLSFFGKGNDALPLNRIFDALKNSLPLVGLVGYSSCRREKVGRDYLTFPLGPLNLHIGDRSFSQINWEMNQRMVETVLNWATPLQGKKIVDLYCGIGNFSLPLANDGADVLGLDQNPFAIQDALQNSKQNGLKTCRFKTANLMRGLKSLISASEKMDLLFLDPPRDGLSKKIIQDIFHLLPSRILYISCSPPTLARDLKILTQNNYTLSRIQPMDLFPQTAHTESISELSLKET